MNILIEKRAFDLLLASTCNDKARYVLNGVNVVIAGEKVTLTSTDTFRLTLIHPEEVSDTAGTGKDGEYTLTVKAIKARTEKCRNGVIINLDSIREEETIEGKYPSWQSIMDSAVNNATLDVVEVSSYAIRTGNFGFNPHFLLDVAKYAGGEIIKGQSKNTAGDEVVIFRGPGVVHLLSPAAKLR